MALTNANGNYLVAEGISFKSNYIYARLYLNQAHRQSGDNAFLKAKILSIAFTKIDNTIPDGFTIDNTKEKTIKKLTYLILKQVEPYNSWSDI